MGDIDYQYLLKRIEAVERENTELRRLLSRNNVRENIEGGSDGKIYLGKLTSVMGRGDSATVQRWGVSSDGSALSGPQLVEQDIYDPFPAIHPTHQLEVGHPVAFAKIGTKNVILLYDCHTVTFI